MYTLDNNCYKVGYSSLPLSLECEDHTGYFHLLVTNSDFGNSGDGLLGGEQFKLQVQSINNPRGIGIEQAFQITSYDTDGRVIDRFTDQEKLFIAMTVISSLVTVYVVPINTVCGEQTEYKLTIIPKK